MHKLLCENSSTGNLQLVTSMEVRYLNEVALAQRTVCSLLLITIHYAKRPQPAQRILILLAPKLKQKFCITSRLPQAESNF